MTNPHGHAGRGRTHLACYETIELGATFKHVDVIVTNQFGNATWRLFRPDSLCVPAEKNAEAPIDAGFNHFRCYEGNISSGFTPRTVVLVDQFDNRTAVAFTGGTLCTPVSKNNERVRDPEYHLACYRIDPLGAFTPRQVRVRDQFGLWTWDVIFPETLCVPSMKTVLRVR